MAVTFKNFSDLVLPQYLIIILFSLVSSYIIIFRMLPDLSLILPFLSLSFAMFALNITNNIIDIDLDKINKPARPLPSGRMSIREAKYLARICVFLSILFAYPINFITFSIIVIFNILSIAYSVPPIRLRRFLLADNIIGSIIYGAFPFIISWSLSTDPLSMVFLLFFTGMIFSIASVKDFEDIKGEKEYKINTLPIRLGIKKSVLFTSSIMMILIVIVYISTLTQIINEIYMYATTFSLFALLVYFSKFKKMALLMEKNIVTQSKLMTLSMIVVSVFFFSMAFVTLL